MWIPLKHWAEALKKEGLTLWFCCRHRDMPWLPKILVIVVVGYFLSPIDLIPAIKFNHTKTFRTTLPAF